jgi:glyoxylase-like metal-dependent hydrolase (beta-lactamase superfamily II)
VSEVDWSVSAIRFATTETTRRASFLRYELYGQPDGALTADYYFWAVRSREGVILFDVGFDAPAARRWGRTLLVSMRECLEVIGTDADDVRTIVVSHLHYDHTGNLDLFPNAELVVQSAEVDFWLSPIARKTQFASVADEAALAALARADAEGRVRRVEGDATVVPGLTTVLLPGHTPGQQGLLVDGPRPVLLTSDAVHYYDELENEMPFVIVNDVADMYRSYERIRALEADGAVVVPGHASEVGTRFGSTPFGTGGLVVDLTSR